MGGVGKTTLVHEVGSQAKKLDLFDKVVIATVSNKPSFEAIQDEIARYLNFNMKDGQSRKSKQEFCSRLQKENRILIILDDVWANINLEEIGIPLGEDHKGCKILLTTRRLQVCQSMDCQKEIQLGCLDEHEAWALFERKAGLENSDEAIMEVAIEVVKTCHGLPISIVTLGSALKGKTLPRWEEVYRRLKTNRLMEIEDIVVRNDYLCLEESFNYLSDMETKICFLLCSLFPEDHVIYMEDLVRYAWGLDLYKGITDSIEGARREVHAAMGILKDSSLLLDCEERYVKMHGTVRDVALWIASYREDIGLVIKSGVVETWPKNECFDSYTAISFITSPIAELPSGLVCPKLRILLLGGNSFCSIRTRSAFFEGMKALQVCSLHFRWISPDAFQFQTKLQTLDLYNCKLSADISLLGRLKDLEVLSLTECYGFEELRDEIGDLTNLRILDLSFCSDLRRIPRNLLLRLSELEELYLFGCYSLSWATEETIEGGGYASLSELNSLSKLIGLSLCVWTDEIPKDFVFQKLLRFDIRVNGTDSRGNGTWISRRDYESYRMRRSLSIEASKIDAFQQLTGDAESLSLENLVGCQNLVGGLELDYSKLTYLSLDSCKDMKCLIDTSENPQAPTIEFCNLVELSTRDMDGLEALCHGPQPQGFLQKLKTLSIWNCNNIMSIPILHNLEKVDVGGCDRLEVLFEPNLRSIQALDDKPNLRSIEDSHEFKSIQGWHRSLKTVEIRFCHKLRYLFPTSVAKSLGQLETLKISCCLEIEEIIQSTKASNVCLQSLRKVKIVECDKLTSLSSLSHGQVLENLTKLKIIECSGLEYTFPFSMAEGLPKLKEVWLKDLPKLKGRDGNDIVLTLSSVQDLELKYCPQLSAPIFTCTSSKIQGSHEFKSIQEWPRSLTIVAISFCHKLRYLFPTPVAKSLGQLEMLKISFCSEIEEIIQSTEASNVCIQSLRKVEIKGCHKLTSLSSLSHGHVLEDLTNLKISYCYGLEYTFPFSMAEGLPELKEVWLEDLPKLKGRDGNDIVLTLPSIQDLEVKYCPQLSAPIFTSTSSKLETVEVEGFKPRYEAQELKPQDKVGDEIIPSKFEASPEIGEEEANQHGDTSSDSWSPSIFRTPYPELGFQEPQLVSIGPYHSGKNLPLDKYKYYFLQNFLSRTRNQGKDLCFYVGQMMTLEWHARRCYSEDLSLATPDFVEIILVDTCFVIEVLRHFGRSGELEDGNLHFPIEPWQIPILVRDLLILENQIPFFFLEKLFELSSDHDGSKEGTATTTVSAITAMALNFFDLAFPRSLDFSSNYNHLELPKHLLDLFLETIRPSNPYTNSLSLLLRSYRFIATTLVNSLPYLFISNSKSMTPATSSNQNEQKPSTLKTAKLGGNAQKLRMSGIEFWARRSDRFTDIHFRNGVLEIPPIIINDLFMSILVNCIAFEHFCTGSGCSKELTAYACFMSGLMRYPADVECLSSDGIMSRFSVENEKVLSFFDNLRSEIADINNIFAQDCYLYQTAMEIDECCSSSWRLYCRSYLKIVLFCITTLWFSFNCFKGLNLR